VFVRPIDRGHLVAQRPNLVGDPALPVGQRASSQWFNTAAFAVAPQVNNLGSASRNPVRR